MATFQVVYDDFSGGQYMGMRPANQPKNTWNGNNVISNANGELIPVGTRTAATFAGVASTTGRIWGHFYGPNEGFIFATYGTATSRFLRYNHVNGTAFPVTMTATTLSHRITSPVAYSYLAGSFYYGGTDTNGLNPSLRSIDPVGNTSNITWSGASPPTINSVHSYKYRLLLRTTLSNRLFYTNVFSGGTYSGLSTSQYYEFNSDILGIYPRTDDVLVVCADGIYSVTGVFGSSINIQLISSEAAVIGTMNQAAIINRDLFYTDGSRFSTGSIDGRLYRMSGISSRPIASFEYGDYYFNDTGQRIASPSSIVSIANSRLTIQFRNGTTYFESAPGVFGKANVWSLAETATSLTNASTYQVAEPIIGCPDEYILTAVVDTTNTASPITAYRTLINTPGPTKLTARFDTTASTPTVNPTGTVELSEYWHSKPFTVKEMFVEYSITTGGSVSASIIPTGVVDVPAATLPSVVSTAASELTPPAGGYRMYRYWPNNASKGFGVKPQLEITNCFVKRVILNCED